MRRAAVRVLALCGALLPAALAAQQPDPHPYQPGIDVLHYDFSLDLPESGPAISGRAELLVSRTAPVDSLVLDLIDLRVDSVRVGGRATAFRRTPATIHVPLTGGAGDTLRVAVYYAGEPEDGFIIRTDALGRWTGFGDNWPNRGRHWLPSVDHPSDKATVAWNVVAPTERRVVANGLLLEETPLAAEPGRTLTRWATQRPIPTYLMVVGAAPLAYYDLGRTACGLSEIPGCVPQSVYVAPEVRDFLPGPFAEADDIVEYFSALVAPYPYEKLAHVQSSTRFGGMENATAIFYSDGAFREGTLDVGLVAHETAHQWFGNAVTEREWAHLWLSEGFATYFTQIYTQHSRGEEAFRSAMRAIREEILAAPEVARRPVVDTAQTDYLELLNTNSYEKGGWTLHMLRSLVGDEAFFAGIRDYYAANRHGTALTADLQAAMERAAGLELGWFFDQWLRRPGFAELTTRWRYDPDQRRVVLDVEQGDRFGAYRFPLVVEVVAERSQRVVLPINLPDEPREIRLDPDAQLLATFSTSRSR